MKRFVGYPVPVKKYSASEVTANGVVDRVNGARGVRCQVRVVTFVSHETARVTGSQYAGFGYGPPTFSYSLSRELGHWTVRGSSLDSVR